ncbi:MAG: 50S ribosomal protein L11 [DPANN group archaeon]|nr:50S ribosomal protein L11 [DPANN group archaeon]
MGTKVIETLVDAGKASAGPPLGPALGPMGVNIGNVIAAINEKTKDFSGMKVPVKVIIDEETKEFKITIGTPPTSQLIKKELNILKGAQKTGEEFVADMKIEQAIKVAKMKMDSMGAKDIKAAVKTVCGTCLSMGVMMEGKSVKEALVDIDNGIYDGKIISGKTELTAEELKVQEDEKKQLIESTKLMHAKEEEVAKQLISQMKGKSPEEVRHRLTEQNIHKDVIEKLLPKTSSKDGKDAGKDAAPKKK